MKKIILATMLCLGIQFVAKSQVSNEKTIETKVGAVTVYTQGALVKREKQINLEKGNTTLKFTGLSPYIDAKSLQVSVDGKVTVLSVRHEFNFMNVKTKSDELEKLSTQRDEITQKINQTKTQQTILGEQLAFLTTNKSIGGANTGINFEELKKTTEFYNSQMAGIISEQNKRSLEFADLNQELVKVNNQMKALNEKTDLPIGEVLVEVSADAKVSANFKLSYLVMNAGWHPSYDIRVKSVVDPMDITYKANVYQNTNVDWTDVKLTFSSGNPSTSGVAPKLNTYYVGFNSMPPVYTTAQASVNSAGKISQVFGTVYDSQTNETLPFTNVVVKNTSIGTVTDIDGRYSLTLPPNAQSLVFSSIGYDNQEVWINGSIINVALHASSRQLQEVMVSGGRYEQRIDNVSSSIDLISPQMIQKMPGKSSGTYTGKNLTEAHRQNIPIEAVKVEYQTNFEFEIKNPYTIPSNGKSLGIEVKDYSIAANYQYYSVPKIEKEAYLTAYIKDWAQYNFMEGEANVFFEETYVGKTLMDTRYLTDSLEISLGKDKNVLVSREIQKDLVSKQFLRNKKEETRAWLVTVRNNKKQEINITVLDQVPVSSSSDIIVEQDELSGGTVDNVTGEVRWDLKVKSQEQISKLLKYKVKYPEAWSVVVE